MKQKIDLTAKILPENRFAMTQAMQKALLILELPISELVHWIESETDTNPLIEKKTSTLIFSNPNLENTVATKPNLYDHLMQQAREAFANAHELSIAKILFQNLDPKGFLAIPIAEIAATKKINTNLLLKIHKKVQLFDPIGIASVNLQSFLLRQLEAKNSENTLSYQIIKDHFQDLLLGHFHLLEKAYKRNKNEIYKNIQQNVKPLYMQPAHEFISHRANHSVASEFEITKKKGKWIVNYGESTLPEINIKKAYVSGYFKKEALSNYLVAAKWLKRSIDRRKKIFISLGGYLIKTQVDFFEGKAKISPLNVAKTAKELRIHESTLRRVLSNKFLHYPNGYLALKEFFSPSFVNQTGKNIVKQDVLEALKKLINHESKENPYSDENLLKELQKKGFSISRRTVTKYRNKLHIASANKRKLSYNSKF